MMILADGIYIIMSQRMTVPGIIAEYPEMIAVVAIQAIVGAKPHKAMVILVDTPDGIVRKTVFDAQAFNPGSLRKSPGDKKHGEGK
jgi:hypothetical protein